LTYKLEKVYVEVVIKSKKLFLPFFLLFKRDTTNLKSTFVENVHKISNSTHTIEQDLETVISPPSGEKGYFSQREITALVFGKFAGGRTDGKYTVILHCLRIFLKGHCHKKSE
jgi:hypothetical protein